MKFNSRILNKTAIRNIQLRFISGKQSFNPEMSNMGSVGNTKWFLVGYFLKIPHMLGAFVKRTSEEILAEAHTYRERFVFYCIFLLEECLGNTHPRNVC